MLGALKRLTGGKADKPAVPRRVAREKRPFCDLQGDKPCITVCAPQGACECDCEAVRAALEKELRARQMTLTVGKAKTGCEGRCENGVIVGFPQKNFFYLGVSPEDVALIVEETLVGGNILFERLSLNPYRSYRGDIYFEKHSGLLAAIDDSVSMVEIAKYFLDFEAGLSCGKCVPCRQGLIRMNECVERLLSDEGSERDLEDIRLVCEAMIMAPYCEFARTTSRPVLSALTYFEDEFLACIPKPPNE